MYVNRLPGHPRGRIGIDRVDDDRIDFLRDEILDLIQLAADIVLGVFELDSGLELLRSRFHVTAHDGEEIVIEQRHGDPHGSRPRRCEQCRQHRGEECECHALHARHAVYGPRLRDATG